MHRRIRAIMPVLALGAGALLAGCSDLLSVKNTGSPDVNNVLATPDLAESFISKLFQQIHNGIYNTSTSIIPGVEGMAFESSSQLNNFNMGPYSTIPRNPIDNSVGNGAQNEQLRIFDQMQRNSRQAVNAILRFETFMTEAAGGSALQDPTRDARALSVAFFALGYSLGTVALAYDSAAIVTPAAVQQDPFGTLPLAGAVDVSNAALAMLDSALAYADQMGTQRIPADWFTVEMNVSDWKRLIHSHKARFRAGVARTPEEANQVDWDAVIADATQGIQKNFTILLSTTTGWGNAWIQQAQVNPTWSQMSPFILGMADTTGAYADWLNLPLTERGNAFLIRTPDKRFPSGNTRDAQTAVTGNSRLIPAGSRIYMRNRPAGEDSPGWPFGTSNYDHIRYAAIALNSGNGPFDDMTVAENDMLAAEGYLRKGDIASAAALIDKTRVPNGLPALSGVITAMDQPVPGGNACVPRVPSQNRPATLSCGNIWEAMKWEKRLETQMNGFASWWIDSRRWGDLVAGTPLEFPVPYQEYNARGKPPYNTVKLAASGNTYGFP